jgi:hypothetical protein
MNALPAPLSAMDVAREATRLLRENTALFYGLALIAAIPAAFFRPVFLGGRIDASTPGVAALPMIAISPEHLWAHGAVQAAFGGLATAWVTALFTVLYFDLRRHGETDFDPTGFAAPLPPA